MAHRSFSIQGDVGCSDAVSEFEAFEPVEDYGAVGGDLSHAVNVCVGVPSRA